LLLLAAEDVFATDDAFTSEDIADAFVTDSLPPPTPPPTYYLPGMSPSPGRLSIPLSPNASLGNGDGVQGTSVGASGAGDGEGDGIDGVVGEFAEPLGLISLQDEPETISLRRSG